MIGDRETSSARVPDALQRVRVAAQSRDPGAAELADAWAPALQRTAEEALRCVRGTRSRTAERGHVNSISTTPSPSSSIRTLSPAFSHSVFTRLPVSTSCPA